MKTRICYQEGVSKGEPKVLTAEKWNELLDSAQVKDICARIASLDTQAADYNERKQALKKRLPVILPHAQSFKNGKRVSADAVASGLAMLDVDHVAEPREWWNSLLKVASTEHLKANGIVLVAVTASGKGLRVIGERLRVTGDGLPETIESTQMRMAEVLGIKEYDAVTKDLARASFVVPRDYVLYVDEEHLLFMNEQRIDATDGKGGQSDCPVREERLALPPHIEQNHADDNAALKVPRTEHLLALPPYNGSNYAAEGENAEPASDAGLTDGELCYRGVPYKEIVEQLLIATGNGGGAEVGERNTVYFMLANYMRYICDFSAEVLLQVLPDFGLGEAERKQAINSAIGRPRKSEMPMVLQGAIAVCERERSIVESQKSKVESRTAAELPLPELPRLLRLLCRRLPEEYRAAMVIASLPVLGTLATRVRFEYLDRQEQSLSFFSCVTAPAASGKSFIRKPVDLLLTPINEQDAIEREKEQAYKDKLRASKNSKNQPEDPHACPRNNGVSISIAKLLQLLTYAEGKHLIGIGEEMDTLVKSERAGVWSQKSDIYRLAFDNAEYGQAYMSDASFNAHIKVYYNLLLTGTPNSMKRFFKDLENGLATRVAFAQLPDTSFTEIPVFAPYSEAEKAEIIRWARQLDAIGNQMSEIRL